MQHKGLVGCCAAWSHISLLQSTIMCCHWSLQYEVKRFTCCHLPCNQQCLLLSSLWQTVYIMIDCCVLASCNGWLIVVTLLAPLQYSCFLQHQNIIVVASLTVHHKSYACCYHCCNWQHTKIWLLSFIIISQLLASCDIPIVVSLFAPSQYDL